METILVTGGASLIGRHTIERLVEIGESRLVTILKPERRDLYLPRDVRVYYTDLREASNLESVFKSHKPDTVVHLAAKSEVKDSFENPADYEENNVRVTLNLLDLSRRYGVNRFIFTSTGQVYNQKSQLPFSEETPADQQDSVYTASKRACELFCYTYSKLSDMKIVCLRLANIYGPEMRRNNIIPQLVEKAYNGGSFKIQGDGTASRDYLDVRDLMEAITLVLTLDTNFEILNIGSSRPTSVIELIEIVQKITGNEIKKQRTKIHSSQDKKIYLDTSKARRLLGWQPKISLEEGIKNYIKYYQSRNYL